MTDGPVAPFDDEFLASLPRLELAAQRLVARAGDSGRRADRRGGRVEFEGHRAYVPGDDPRHIDWPAFARTERLVLKEFGRRDEYSIVLVVDDSASMTHGGKLVAAQRLAYAIAYLALAAGHRVRGALASDGDLRISAEIALRARLRDLGSFLIGARGRGATRLTESLRHLREDGRGGRLVIAISDLWADDDGRDAFAIRVRRGDDVSVFHLVAASDLAVPAEYVIAEDVETGERRALGPGASDAAAIEAARRESDWRAFAARHAFVYLPLDASRPTEDLVRHTLRDAGVLR